MSIKDLYEPIAGDEKEGNDKSVKKQKSEDKKLDPNSLLYKLTPPDRLSAVLRAAGVALISTIVIGCIKWQLEGGYNGLALLGYWELLFAIFATSFLFFYFLLFGPAFKHLGIQKSSQIDKE